MIHRARIVEERVDPSQSVTVDFVVDHALDRVAEHLHCNSPFLAKARKQQHDRTNTKNLQKIETHLVDFVDEHTEIRNLRIIIAAQIRMTSFHTVIIRPLNLARRGIRKLITPGNQILKINQRLIQKWRLCNSSRKKSESTAEHWLDVNVKFQYYLSPQVGVGRLIN